MCGIFGYIGNRTDAASVVLDGLKDLEYRGYDSWGVVAVNTKSGLVMKKAVGKIGTATLSDFPDSSLAIGHTRWATHGGVTVENAHPHTDCTGSIAIIHNGIIENYEELKKTLVAEGHVFASGTDSEIIAHLLENRRDLPLDVAARQVFGLLEGLNAIIAIRSSDRQIVAIRKGSPLVVGYGKNEYFLASDISALLPYTRNVYFLRDGEVALLTPDGIAVTDAENGDRKKIRPETIDRQNEIVGLNGYPNYLEKELREQPEAIRRIAVNENRNVERLASAIIRAKETYLVACGSASYAALAGEYLFSKIARRHINWAIASEFTYQEDFLDNKSLVIALSQSGETMDTLESLRASAKKGATTAAFVNAVGSTMEREVQIHVPIGVGTEKAVCSTKAVTGKLAHLIRMAHSIAGTLGEGQRELQSAGSAIEMLLTPSRFKNIWEIGTSMKMKTDAYVIGRGLSYPAALETAMKLKEIAYIHAEGLAAGELKHGPIALIEPDMPCIVFLPDDETYGATLSGAMELKARGGRIIGISARRHGIFDEYIEVPDVGPSTIIPNIVVGQILAYALTTAKNLDPDKPRNLAKSVTVK